MQVNGSGLWIIIALLLGAGGGYYVTTKYFCAPGVMPGDKTAQLDTALRKLWADHVIWTRQFIIAALNKSPDLDAASERLMKNQEDLGNAIVPFYGKEAGVKLTELLKDHIKISTKVVSAAAQNDQEALKAADAEWHKNADDIAQFLSQANPNWPYAEMQKMLYEHLKVTTDEAVARIKKDWSADVQAFDVVFDQALGMADGFAAGIAKQFPERF